MYSWKNNIACLFAWHNDKILPAASSHSCRWKSVSPFAQVNNEQLSRSSQLCVFIELYFYAPQAHLNNLCHTLTAAACLRWLKPIFYEWLTLAQQHSQSKKRIVIAAKKYENKKRANSLVFVLALTKAMVQLNVSKENVVEKNGLTQRELIKTWHIPNPSYVQ